MRYYNIRMIRIVLFLLIGIFPFVCNADELHVKSLKNDPFDLSAAVNQIKGKDGKACALLKIVLPKEANNVIFEGNTIDIQNDGSEVLVYLSSGSKWIQIKSAGFDPLMVDFKDYGIPSLEGKQTYLMSIEKVKPLYERKRQANGTALAYSIIPGVGLIQKGHKAEGATYLVVDVAFIAAGIGLNSAASRQKKIMDDVNTSIDQYNSAKSKRNNYKTGSYICYGAAAGIYIVNLIRSYVAPPKPGAKITWEIRPELTTANQFNQPFGSINMALTYTF